MNEDILKSHFGYQTIEGKDPEIRIFPGISCWGKAASPVVTARELVSWREIPDSPEDLSDSLRERLELRL